MLENRRPKAGCGEGAKQANFFELSFRCILGHIRSVESFLKKMGPKNRWDLFWKSLTPKAQNAEIPREAGTRTAVKTEAGPP